MGPLCLLPAHPTIVRNDEALADVRMEIVAVIDERRRVERMPPTKDDLQAAIARTPRAMSGWKAKRHSICEAVGQIAVREITR
jgi:hypothetical protein